MPRGDGSNLVIQLKKKKVTLINQSVFKPLVGADVEVITSGMRAVPQDTKDVIARTFQSIGLQ